MLAAPSHVRLTDHFLRRARSRGLSITMIEAIVCLGTEIHAADALHTTIVRDHLHPDDIDDPVVQRSLDWILVASADGSTLITCYRRPGAHRFLRFKRGRRRAPRSASGHRR